MKRSLFCLALAACTQFPEVDAVTATDLETPSLLPNENLTVATATITADPLATRVAALRARAAALRNR